MTPETQKRIKALLDGVASGMSAGKSFQTVVAGLLRGIDYAREKLLEIDTEQSIWAILERMEEPSAEEVMMLEGLAPVIPQVLNMIVQSKVEESLKKLPGAPMGRRRISQSVKIEICDEVAHLVRNECSPSAAKRRVATRPGKTVRTIERVWAKRHEYRAGADPEKIKLLVMSFLAKQSESCE